MAIVKMSEFQLILLNEHVEPLLEKMQFYGNISFKDISGEATTFFQKEKSDYNFERNRFMREHLKDILASIKLIEKKQKKRRKQPLLSISFSELVRRCQHIDIELLLDTYDKYYDVSKGMIEGYDSYRPWTENVRMRSADIVALSKEKAIIGTIESADGKKFAAELQKVGDTFFMTKPSSAQTHIVVILPGTRKRTQIDIILDKYHFQRRSSKSLQISDDIKELHDQLNQLIEKRKNIEETLGNIGNYREELQLYYEYLNNEMLRYETSEKFLKSADTTRIDGWIFTSETEKFIQLLEDITDNHFVVDITETPSDSEDVPIKLKNNRLVQAFEGITNMYSLPKYNEVDPTPLFTPFYAIFFGMMLGDVGYGLLMGLVTFLVLKFGTFKEGTANFIRFLMYLSVPTTLIGWAYGSFFGGVVPIKGILDINKDFMTVLVFSICFGLFHLFFGLAVKGYLFFKWKHPWYILFDVIFWYMALGGAIILVSQMFTPLLAPYTQVGWIILIVGMVGIVLTNGRDAKTPFGKLASGLYSLYGITGYIGDVLSYSRLMALGLAGASIGFAFNLIVEMLSGFGIIGMLAGAIVFVGGHAFNMGISGLSSYVHSARLTYVEFFDKFYTGGGKRFHEFRSPNTYINITREED
ncbi:V-type ATP synthase subunit I [Vagococcus acidifermentans]|uniref:Uncharacterized protein n=1 Tax=Vagococcus acidifermentans TaxID=564710 RepID=A0A430B2I8_9ENTE|nr:V-type ATP synthase subunit I [Vagococcus acidifermentans]RSU14518.1 hypothetical protein CBF27_00590 [Vagococcus acidifermentans]